MGSFRGDLLAAWVRTESDRLGGVNSLHAALLKLCQDGRKISNDAIWNWYHGKLKRWISEDSLELIARYRGEDKEVTRAWLQGRTIDDEETIALFDLSQWLASASDAEIVKGFGEYYDRLIGILGQLNASVTQITDNYDKNHCGEVEMQPLKPSRGRIVGLMLLEQSKRQMDDRAFAAYLDVPLSVVTAIKDMKCTQQKIDPLDLIRIADRVGDEVGAYHEGDGEWHEFWINSLGHLEGCSEHAHQSLSN